MAAAATNKRAVWGGTGLRCSNVAKDARVVSSTFPLHLALQNTTVSSPGPRLPLPAIGWGWETADANIPSPRHPPHTRQRCSGNVKTVTSWASILRTSFGSAPAQTTKGAAIPACPWISLLLAPHPRPSLAALHVRGTAQPGTPSRVVGPVLLSAYGRRGPHREVNCN